MQSDDRAETLPTAPSSLVSHLEREREIQATKAYAGRHSLAFLRLVRAKLADRMREVDERSAEILRVRGEVIHKEISMLEASTVRSAMRSFNRGQPTDRYIAQELIHACDADRPLGK